MKKGLTLIELLLTMALAGLVMVVLITLLVSLIGFNRRSKEIDEFAQTKQQIITQFSNAFRWSEKDGIDISPPSFCFTLEGEAQNCYVYDSLSKSIILNGSQIHSQEVLIDYVTFDDKSVVSGYSGFNVEIGMTLKSNTSQSDVLKFNVSQRITKFTEI